jgi:CubicO group peptidase (beta-lactamase class C family)
LAEVAAAHRPSNDMPLARRHRDRRIARTACAILLLGALTHAAWGQVWPRERWSTAEPDKVGLREESLVQARDYALTGGGAGYITRHGRLVMAWGDPGQLYDLKSTTKSIGGTLLGLALHDGLVELDDLAAGHHPHFGTPPETNADRGWHDRITLRQLAHQTAGFEKPGGFERLLFEPGTQWHYSDGGPNWLAECLTLRYRRDLNEVLFERVLTPLGVKPEDLRWRKNAYRPDEIQAIKRREFGSGISANVDAMARIGYLYLRRGKWQDRQIIPAEYVERASRPAPENFGLPEHDPRHGNASDHYSLLWWNNGDGTIDGLPRDAYWSWGLYDSLIVVIPSLDIVAARAGRSWERTGDEHYSVLEPFLEPLAAAAGSSSEGLEIAASADGDLPTSGDALQPAPYPPSRIIASIRWAPAGSIVRRARGSDNWPITWADDGRLYTAYGDGQGFSPPVPEKLSLVLARIAGPADDFEGVNLRSPSMEFRGDGRSGPKASGILMVDGVLYLLVRNRDNAQLAWSADHGRSWTWCEWRFAESFACPTFLNFGRNYRGSRDEYVYVYSHDAASAYEAADRMVLARVPKSEIARREAYEFFVELADDGSPVWTRDVGGRGVVFSHPGRCYRSGISYCAPLGRYLWCQILPESDHPQGPRFQGGFGIYDAAEPWGPWTTAYFSENWDVGPGETASFPTKWMSDDGRTLYLVFSGDDSFSVRRAELQTGSPRD